MSAAAGVRVSTGSDRVERYVFLPEVHRGDDDELYGGQK